MMWCGRRCVIIEASGGVKRRKDKRERRGRHSQTWHTVWCENLTMDFNLENWKQSKVRQHDRCYSTCQHHYLTKHIRNSFFLQQIRNYVAHRLDAIWSERWLVHMKNDEWINYPSKPLLISTAVVFAIPAKKEFPWHKYSRRIQYRIRAINNVSDLWCVY